MASPGAEGVFLAHPGRLVVESTDDEIGTGKKKENKTVYLLGLKYY